jgi:hypothetical protein
MIKVFKVDDHTTYDCYHIDKYILGMFKGTEDEFNEFYLDKVGHLPLKDYMVYDNPEEVKRVVHGFKDNNTGRVKQSTRDSQQRYASKVYLKSAFN